MVDFQEDIHEIVVVEQIAADAGALGHPVQPDAFLCIVDAVVFNQGVDAGMQLDSGHLRAPEVAVGVDVIDVVARDLAKGGAEAPGHAGLPAAVNGVVPYQMRSNGGSGPACLQHVLHHVVVMYRTVDLAVLKPEVVARGPVLAQGNAHTFAVRYGIVFDDPAFAPVGADDPGLLCRGRGPLGSRLREAKALDGDEVDAGPLRIDTGGADIDLYGLLVGIDMAEITGDQGGVGADLTAPAVWTVWTRPFPQRFSVEVDLPGMHLVSSGEKPVSKYQVQVRVVCAKEAVGYACFPYPSALFPVSDDLGALDLHFLPGRGPIGDAQRGGRSAVVRHDKFPVDAGMHGDDVSRNGQTRRPGDGQEWFFPAALVSVVSGLGHMVFGSSGTGPGQQDQ